MWRNTDSSYGLVAATLHWLVALTVIGLFTLGLWMTGLGYYDPWYRDAPHIHRSLGVLLFVVVIARLAWRHLDPPPPPLTAHTTVEQRLARFVHGLLYVLLLAVMVVGYLVSTADGRPVDVFSLFEVPATISGIENQEDLAGDIHLGLAIAVVSLAGMHALAALKHQFIDRDGTLMRMLGRDPR